MIALFLSKFEFTCAAWNIFVQTQRGRCLKRRHRRAGAALVGFWRGSRLAVDYYIESQESSEKLQVWGTHADTVLRTYLHLLSLSQMECHCDVGGGRGPGK